MLYTIKADTPMHTCWGDPAWDGMLHPEECAACAEAIQHPCVYCGYGEVFTTHNDIAHAENGDITPYPSNTSDQIDWHNKPHIYEQENHHDHLN